MDLALYCDNACLDVFLAISAASLMDDVFIFIERFLFIRNGKKEKEDIMILSKFPWKSIKKLQGNLKVFLKVSLALLFWCRENFKKSFKKTSKFS